MAINYSKATNIVQGMTPEQKKQAQALFAKANKQNSAAVAPDQYAGSKGLSQSFKTARKGVTPNSAPTTKSALSGYTSRAELENRVGTAQPQATQGGMAAGQTQLPGTGTQANIAAGMADAGQPTIGGQQPIQQRAEPRVATPDQPFVNRDASPSGFEFADFGGIQDYDSTQLQDFTDAMMVKQQMGQTLSQDEMLKLTKAQRLMQAEQQEIPQLAQQELDEAQARYTATEAALGTQTADLVEAKKAELQQQYEQRAGELTEAGAKQQQAGQTAMSFSGFGRSTAASEQAQEIEKSVQANIATLATARDLELQMFEAQQRGANAEELSGMRTQINGLRQQAFEEKAAAITEANRINQETNLSYQDKISNLLEVATQGDMTEPSEQEMSMIPAWAEAAVDNDGNLDSKILSQLPEHLIPLVIAQASNVSGNADAPKIQKIGKNTYGYFKDGELVNVSGGSFGGGGITGTGGYGSGSGGTLMASDAGSIPSARDLDTIIDEASATAKFKNQYSGASFDFATKMMRAEANIREMEDEILSMSKAGFEVQKNLDAIPFGKNVQDQSMRRWEQAQDTFINSQLRKESGAAIGKDEFKGAYKQYMPVPGDSPEVIAQKRRGREIAVQNMANQSGQTSLTEGLDIIRGMETTGKTSPTPTAQPQQEAPTAGPVSTADMDDLFAQFQGG